MGEKAPFIHYPEARPGPTVPYRNEEQVIPVIRGLPLAIGASLYVFFSHHLPSQPQLLNHLPSLVSRTLASSRAISGGPLASMSSATSPSTNTPPDMIRP